MSQGSTGRATDTAAVKNAYESALGAISAAEEGQFAAALEEGKLAIDRAAAALEIDEYIKNSDSDGVRQIAEAAKEKLSSASAAELEKIVEDAKLDMEKQRAKEEIIAAGVMMYIYAAAIGPWREDKKNRLAASAERSEKQ